MPSTMATVGGGAGSGAASGAVKGFSMGGPIGAVAGGIMGGVLGGASGYFKGSALNKTKSDVDEANARYLQALQEYDTGMRRTQGWEEGQYSQNAAQQTNEMGAGIGRMQTGKQGAQQLQDEYTKALTSATQSAGGPVKAASGTPSYLSDAYAKEATSRLQASMLPASYNLAHQQTTATAQQAVAIHGLNEARLNAQLAQIANTAGIEKAALAAKFAAATGRYPLDMEAASHAGTRDAFIGGAIDMLSPFAGNMGGMLAGPKGENASTSALPGIDKVVPSTSMNMA